MCSHHRGRHHSHRPSASYARFHALSARRLTHHYALPPSPRREIMSSTICDAHHQLAAHRDERARQLEEAAPDRRGVHLRVLGRRWLSRKHEHGGRQGLGRAAGRPASAAVLNLRRRQPQSMNPPHLRYTLRPSKKSYRCGPFCSTTTARCPLYYGGRTSTALARATTIGFANENL